MFFRYEKIIQCQTGAMMTSSKVTVHRVEQTDETTGTNMTHMTDEGSGNNGG